MDLLFTISVSSIFLSLVINLKEALGEGRKEVQMIVFNAVL